MKQWVLDKLEVVDLTNRMIYYCGGGTRFVRYLIMTKDNRQLPQQLLPFSTCDTYPSVGTDAYVVQ